MMTQTTPQAKLNFLKIQFCLTTSLTLSLLITLGLGMLFVQPYMLTARAAFYEDLKEEKLVEEAEEATDTEIE